MYRTVKFILAVRTVHKSFRKQSNDLVAVVYTVCHAVSERNTDNKIPVVYTTRQIMFFFKKGKELSFHPETVFMVVYYKGVVFEIYGQQSQQLKFQVAR